MSIMFQPLPLMSVSSSAAESSFSRSHVANLFWHIANSYGSSLDLNNTDVPPFWGDTTKVRPSTRCKSSLDWMEASQHHLELPSWTLTRPSKHLNILWMNPHHWSPRLPSFMLPPPCLTVGVKEFSFVSFFQILAVFLHLGPLFPWIKSLYNDIF